MVESVFFFWLQNLDSFKWPEGHFRKFVEGYAKYQKIIVNNEKIAMFMGAGVSPNHVKCVKIKFLKFLKKRAKDC